MARFFDVTMWSCTVVAVIAMVIGSLELFILTCLVATLAIVTEEYNRPR